MSGRPRCSDPSMTSSSEGVSTRPAIQSLLIRAGSMPQTLKLYGCMKWRVIPAPKVRCDHSRKLAGGAAWPFPLPLPLPLPTAAASAGGAFRLASMTPSRHSLTTAGGRPKRFPWNG